MIDRGKHSVLGVRVDAVDYDAAVARILDAAGRRHAITVTALAVHGVMTGVLDREHNFRLNQFDIVCPDGQPVRWALNWLHRIGLEDRVYGPELTLRISAACAEAGLPIYLFGGTEEILAALRSRLRDRYPTLVIAGSKPSRFRRLDPSERDALAAEINGSGAGVCFVGLGCPRQETFAFEMRDHIRMPTVAVGAAFAFHAGLLPQAPPWMQRHGLEWLYRLLCEPRRLWRRYVYLNPMYLSLIVAQRAGIIRGRTDRGTRPHNEWLFG